MSKLFGGRYEVLEQIGSGGMAIVYKAKDMLLNRVVTIKVLREQFLTDDEFIRRFRREAQSAASLSHPNIVSIYDVGKDGNVEYIVMEYIEGRTLKEIIRDYAPLSTEHAINLARQIGEAIRHAHEHHIIHRDIKPQNILVTADGRAKVTDFGIARAVSAATVTHTGDIVGSVHYLSPEQAKGIQSNEQSDIYSLGIILYELLTGKVPYDGETPIAIALKHLQEQALLPSKVNPRIGKDLEAVIMRAIAKSSETRYATAKEFLDDLDHVQAGRPLAAKPFPPESGDMEATQIHRSLVQAISAETAGVKDGKAPLKRKRWPWVLGVSLVLLLILVGGGLWLRSYIRTATTTVPNLAGLTVAEAGIQVQNAKLQLDQNVSDDYSDTVEKGKIISQLPEANSIVKVGREIKIVVSKGQEILKFPALKGQNISQDNAITLLQNSGFTATPTIETRNDPTVPAGIVIDQDPAPNSQWAKNGSIHLVISGGPQLQTIKMPNVIGRSSTDARNILEQNQLVVGQIESQNSNVYPADVVISTNPQPDAQVQQGAQVTMVVSRGPGPLAQQIDQKVILASLLHVVPNDGKPHDVSIRLNDYRGVTEVWRNPYQVGATTGIPSQIRYFPPATMQILVDGTLQLENKYS